MLNSEIDVSKCEFYCEKYDGCYCFNSSKEVYAVNPNEHNSCEANKDCHYKKLQKAKQYNYDAGQQLIRMSQELQQYKQLCEQKTVDNFDLMSKIEQLKSNNKKYKQQLQQLKQENDELKKKLKTIYDILDMCESCNCTDCKYEYCDNCTSLNNNDIMKLINQAKGE